MYSKREVPFSRFGSLRLVLSLMNVSSFSRPGSSRNEPKAQAMQKMKV